MQRMQKRMASTTRYDWIKHHPMPILTEHKKLPYGTFRNQYQLEGNQVVEIRDVIVHKFKMGDVEDPDIMAGEPLYAWQKSEMGEWVLKHAVETPIWNRHADMATYGHIYTILAKLRAKDYTFWALKWGNDVDKKCKL